MANRIGVMVDSFTLGVLDGLDAAKKVGAAAVQIYVGGRGAVTETWTPAFRKDVAAKMADNGLCVSAMCGDMGGHGFAKREEHEWRSTRPDYCHRPHSTLHPRYLLFYDSTHHLLVEDVFA